MKTLKVFFVASLALLSHFGNAAEIKEIKFRLVDGFGGDTGSIANRCITKVGSEYDPQILSSDVNSLKESGEFDEVSAEAEKAENGIEITFYVKRKMCLRFPVKIEGAVAFSESKILDKSELEDGALYGEGDLAAAAEKLREVYIKKNYRDAKVSITSIPTGSSNNCNVLILIDEGVCQDIDDCVFEGATVVSASELKNAIGWLPWWNPMGWFSDKPLTDAALGDAVSKIKTLYRNLGYLDVEVAFPEQVRSNENPEKYVLNYRITEGTKYLIGDIRIDGLKKYAPGEVATRSKLPKPGEVAGEKILSDAAERISITVGSGDLGLADTRVEVKRMLSAKSADTLDIVFKVVEGVPVIINEVKVVGNDYTKDKVVRREITLGPGDRMLADRAEQAKRRLENLDYFSRVRYWLEPTGKVDEKTGGEYRDLVYEVAEKNTGSFMVGIGASSVDSVYVSAEVSQSNFDLFAPGKLFRGAGQKGRLYVAAGPRIQTYEAAITEPHLFDRHLELEVSAYRRQRWYDEYDIVRTGAGASLSYPVKFWPTWRTFGRFGVKLYAELIEFDDVENDYYYYNGRYGQLLREEEEKYGDALEGVARLFWAHDTRDNFRIPTTGSRTQVFADFAGGDNEYVRFGANHRSYFTVIERYKHVFMVALRGETICGDDIPIYNRMFLGGPKSIRGIEYRNVSPFARRSDKNGKFSGDYTPWGGQTLFCANFEYTIPIVKMFRLAFFSDVGSVAEDEFDLDFSDTFAWTAGMGLRLDLPMFPIRLDFATPIEKPDEAEKEVFSFTIGYDF